MIASKEIYDTFMAAGGPEYMLEFPARLHLLGPPRGLRGGHCGARHPAKEDMIGRVKALAPYFENAVHSLKGAKACGRHPQLWPGCWLHHCRRARRACQAPLRDCDEVLGKGLYVRYGGDTIQLAPPFISTEAEIDRLVSALGDALHETA